MIMMATNHLLALHAPNKNLIALIGGYNNSTRIDLYHLEMEIGK